MAQFAMSEVLSGSYSDLIRPWSNQHRQIESYNFIPYASGTVSTIYVPVPTPVPRRYKLRGWNPGPGQWEYWTGTDPLTPGPEPGLLHVSSVLLAER